MRIWILFALSMATGLLLVTRARAEGARHAGSEAAPAKVMVAERLLSELRFEAVRSLVSMGRLEQAVRAHRHYVASFKAPLERLLAAARFGELIQRREPV